MNDARLHIAIFDGSLKTTPFINRLIRGLSKHHRVTVIGFAKGTKFEAIPSVRYITVGSAGAGRSLIALSFQFALKALLKKGDVNAFFKSLRHLLSFQKRKLQQHNFNLALQWCAPDILHVQWPSLLPWCELALASEQLKVVLSQRGYQNNVRPFVNPENLAYLRTQYPKIDGFHSVSKAMVAVGDTIYHHPDKIDRVVYSGFNFEELPFNETYTRGEPLQILSIGRPHWVKGYDTALAACNILQQKGVPFRYTIVGGEGNEELRFLVNAYGLNEQAILTPKISQKAVYETMAAHDVLLFPSLAEGLPNVVVEAMAVGLPVISTRCGGVSELLDNETGALVPLRNPKAMAEAISAFRTTSKSKIEEQRVLARSRVEIRHSTTQMVEGMEALYGKVLGAN